MNSEIFEGIEVGKPTMLIDNLDYEEDGIGRKIIFADRKVRLIQFALSEEKGLVTSKAQGDVLVYVLEGALEIELEGKDYTVNTGEYMVLPKDYPHTIETDSKTKMIFMLVE